MNESKRPFWESTFSIATLIISIGLTILCIQMKDVITLKEIAMMVLGAYGVKKGMEIGKNGGTNGEPPKPA